jgi:hypothetical protein
MKPRDFLNFFKTKSRKLVLFVAIFGGGLLLFSALHGKSGSNDDMDNHTSWLAPPKHTDRNEA